MSLPFSIPVTIGAYAVVWVVLHLGCGYLAHLLPGKLFEPESPLGRLMRTRCWESNGRIYLRLGIRKWKNLLPEAGALFRGGISKRHLASWELPHLRLFRRETNRAEFSHWLTLLSGATFFAWNPWWVGIFMMGYAMVTNLPFIAVQRFNRPRLTAFAARIDRLRPSR